MTMTMLEMLETMGWASLDAFWLPVALWTLMAAFALAVLRLGRFQHTRSTYADLLYKTLSTEGPTFAAGFFFITL